MSKDNINKYYVTMFDFKPSLYQLNYSFDVVNYRDVVAVFCRQTGKSETTSKAVLILARRRPKYEVLIFAPTDKQTGEIADKITATLGKMFYLTDFHITRQTQREFEFSNGSKIRCFTVGKDGENIRGLTGDHIILEEAGSIKNKILSNVIMAMGAHTNAPIVKIGTPRGKNHFYESSIDPECSLHQISWRDGVEAGITSSKYIEKMRKKLTQMEFDTEMNALFMEDQDAYFKYDIIKSCIADIKQEPKRKKHKRYVMGMDVARMGEDHSVYVIIELGNVNRVRYIHHLRKNTTDEAVDEAVRLHKIFQFEKIHVDMTGLGAGVVDYLKKIIDGDRYRKTENSSFSKSVMSYEVVRGITFSIDTKMDMYSNLLRLMEHTHLEKDGGLVFPNNQKLIDELVDFRYERVDSSDKIKLHHPDGGHDDYCDALALAAKGIAISKEFVFG